MYKARDKSGKFASPSNYQNGKIVLCNIRTARKHEKTPINPAEEVSKKMQNIIVQTFEGNKELTGECVKSELYWSKNVEERIPLRNAGQFATKQVPTDCFNEEWKFEGFDKTIKLTKFITPDGIRYVAKEESDNTLSESK